MEENSRKYMTLLIKTRVNIIPWYLVLKEDMVGSVEKLREEKWRVLCGR